MNRLRHALAAAGAVLVALMAAAAPAVAADAVSARPPIDLFFANPQFARAALSPDGRYLAAISGAPGRRDVLVVMDLQSKAPKIVAGYSNVDVLAFEWVNDMRLLFSVSDKQIGPDGAYLAGGLYAVDRDGGDLRQLAAQNGNSGAPAVGSRLQTQRLLPWYAGMLGQRGAQDSDWAYVEVPEIGNAGTVRAIDLLQLNTRTGQTRKVPPPGPAYRWLLDDAGEPRLAMTAQDGVTKVHYRDPAGGAWRVIAAFDSYTGGRDAFEPLGFGSDGVLYVGKNDGRDTMALHTFDLASGKVNPQPLIVTDGYDFDGVPVGHRGKLLGFTLLTDAYSSVWFDKDMAALQKKVDALLPGTNNLLSVASRAGTPWVLVRAYSDRQPSTWLVYHVASGALSPVGGAHPGIDPARMGRQQPVRYKARDGREIPGLLTLPAGGGKNLPLVLLVHGGPYVRGSSWGWDAQSQFLASRGYAVLEPAFRGSTGFGRAHFEAGWKQWGLAMQDDIADGARWAVAQGHADPKRICIMGASYGGYATLMGLVRDPDLYRCGVNWVGVSDISLLYSGHWSFESDLGAAWKKFGMPVLVGDPVRDAAQLKATSPIEQAARITQPLLLAYGGADLRVPIVHGTRLRDAVTRTNKAVEWVEYPREGHGWSLPQNRVDFWGRVERFLDRHIGKDAVR